MEKSRSNELNGFLINQPKQWGMAGGMGGVRLRGAKVARETKNMATK